MSPLVTIGIPCFNNAQWLHAAIESALAQTWENCEVIVADNGSTDTSRLVANAFGDRVEVITARPRGANVARNEILKRAAGEWVQYLDADDYLETEKIERQLAETRGGAEADVIYSPFWTEQNGQRTLHEIDPKQDVIKQWLAWQLPQTGGCLWRREALERIGGWRDDQPCCQENELYLRAIQGGLRFVFAPGAHAVYRLWSEETLCRRDPRRAARVRGDLTEACREWMTKQGRWTAEHERMAGQAYFELSRTLARHDLREAAAYHRDHRRRGLVRLTGPAAPRSYRVAYRLLGFKAAERFAAAMRNLQRSEN